jgi:hypothetical protein
MIGMKGVARDWHSALSTSKYFSTSRAPFISSLLRVKQIEPLQL